MSWHVWCYLQKALVCYQANYIMTSARCDATHGIRLCTDLCNMRSHFPGRFPQTTAHRKGEADKALQIHSRKICRNESFLCLGHPEPRIRHQELIFHSQQSKWNIKITFGVKLFNSNLRNLHLMMHASLYANQLRTSLKGVVSFKILYNTSISVIYPSFLTR